MPNSSDLPARNHATWGFILIIASLTAIGPLTIDMFLPSLPTITAEFRADPAFAQASVAVFFIGLAIGQFIYGPVSDRIGRRMPILFGISLYLIMSFLIAISESAQVLLLSRFIQGLGACAGMVVARATVRDCFDQQEMAKIFSLLALVAGLAPVLAPLAGGVVLEFFGWRAIFYFLTGFGVLVVVIVALGLPETRSEETALNARNEHPLRTYLFLLKNKKLLGYLLAGAFNGAAMFTYISSSPSLLIGTYGISPINFGWIFGVNSIGLIAGSQLNRVFLGRYSSDNILWLAAMTTAFFSLCLLLGAISGFMGLWGVLVPLFFTISSTSVIMANAMAGALSLETVHAGSVSALVGGSSFGVGAIASMISGILQDGTAVPMALVISLSMIACVIALYLLALKESN
jgi:MFS transporter, DHA1 family, multidrug resistance protein